MPDRTDLDQFAAEFARTALDLPIVTVPSGRRFLRLINTKYPSGLGIGYGSTRFSDPRYQPGDSPAGLFKTLYATETLETAFDEVILRDLRDGLRGPLILSRTELQSCDVCCLESIKAIRLVDLSHPRGRRIGVPTDVTGHSNHALSQCYALALHDHPLQLDGIYYRSRFTHAANLAIFDRAVTSCLVEVSREPLLTYDLRAILRDRDIAVAL